VSSRLQRKLFAGHGDARLDEAMSDGRDNPSTPFPDGVPVLVDTATGVILRAHGEADLPAIAEQCRDADTQRWTTVPIPAGGYGVADARSFVDSHARDGWVSGQAPTWAIEAPVGEANVFCGSISLRLEGDGIAEIAFGLHPAARGRSIMSSAIRLSRDYGFDVLGLRVLRWRAVVGNWGSRRAVAAAGFRFDGTVRQLLVHRGELLDGWVATMTADDPRPSLGWADPPVLTGADIVLRPFVQSDAPRIVEACSDPRTRHWLVSLPAPYGRPEAMDFLEATRETAAQRTGLNWCVADRSSGVCLGSISLLGFGGYSRRAEIGYWAHPGARGAGVTTAAVQLVTEHAEANHLIDSLVIRCAAGNTASRHVAEGSGYQLSGVLPTAEPLGDGSLADLVTYSRP